MMKRKGRTICFTESYLLIQHTTQGKILSQHPWETISQVVLHSTGVNLSFPLNFVSHGSQDLNLKSFSIEYNNVGIDKFFSENSLEIVTNLIQMAKSAGNSTVVISTDLGTVGGENLKIGPKYQMSLPQDLSYFVRRLS